MWWRNLWTAPRISCFLHLNVSSHTFAKPPMQRNATVLPPSSIWHYWHPADVVWLDSLSLPAPENKCHIPQQQCRCHPAPSAASKGGNRHAVSTKCFFYFGINLKIIGKPGNGSEKTTSLFLSLFLWLASCGHTWANTEKGKMRRRRQRSELHDHRIME